MSDSGRTLDELQMTCDEVAELSGLYVLGALEPAEHEAVRSHLAWCEQVHAEVLEVGAVVPALAMLVEPIEAPAALKSRVMDAVAAERAPAPAVVASDAPGRTSTAGRVPQPRVSAPTGAAWQVPVATWKLPAWASWGSVVAALIIVASVGVWALGVQSRASTAEERAAILTEAIRSFSSPDTSIAILRENAAGGSSGFATVADDGTAYLVMANMAPLPADQTYQAWYIVGEQAISAGLLTADENGLAVFVDSDAELGAQVVALTREPIDGSDQPTSAPFVTGELRRQA